MNTREPQLQDFGITTEEYALYNGETPEGYVFLRDGRYPSSKDEISGFGCAGGIAAAAIVATVTILFAREPNGTAFFALVGLSICLGYGGVTVVADAVRRRRWARKRARLLKSPVVASRVKRYEHALTVYWAAKTKVEEEAERVRREAERAQWAREEAERARRRTLVEYWMSLSGLEFELEMANLYARLGYRVESTPTSGDQGIDLVLRKDGRTTVVQCKSHKSPVGPAVVRELFGSMVASGANGAILACTGGFTKGAVEFAQGRPITLVSAEDIVTLGVNVEGETEDRRNSPPICPTPGCAKAMVLREGRNGLFWGCPAFPRCRGNRRAS